MDEQLEESIKMEIFDVSEDLKEYLLEKTYSTTVLLETSEVSYTVKCQVTACRKYQFSLLIREGAGDQGLSTNNMYRCM